MPRTKKQSTEAAVREIRRRTRRMFAPEGKIRIVLEGLRGEQSISELCRREGIAETAPVLPTPSSFSADRLACFATAPAKTIHLRQSCSTAGRRRRRYPPTTTSHDLLSSSESRTERDPQRAAVIPRGRSQSVLLSGYLLQRDALQLPELTTETKNPLWTFNPSVQGSSPCGPTTVRRRISRTAASVDCFFVLGMLRLSSESLDPAKCLLD